MFVVRPRSDVTVLRYQPLCYLITAESNTERGEIDRLSPFDLVEFCITDKAYL